MADPTYDRELIRANPEWDLAFALSEIQNDNAPLGWGRFISVARCLRDHYTITAKAAAPSDTTAEGTKDGG